MPELPLDVAYALEGLQQHYSDFEQNDRGGNGYLFFARNRITHEPIAIKFYAGEPGDARHSEPRQLSSIVSRNVLRILDARNVSEEWAYFITPRCFEGDLDDLIPRAPSVHAAIDVSLGICNGVGAIHAMRMLHRDLKPGNVVLLNGAPQIADFGSVRAVDERSGGVSASSHTVLYRPPEAFGAGLYTTRGDVYQIGIVAYQLLGGALPYDPCAYFSSADHRNYARLSNCADRSLYEDDVIRRRAQRGSLVDFASLPPWIDAAARRTLRAIIDPDPGRRPATVADVAAAFLQMRASLRNWAWRGDTASLQGDGRIVELRQYDAVQGLYVAFQSSRESGPFRRVPRMPAAPLGELVLQF